MLYIYINECRVSYNIYNSRKTQDLTKNWWVGSLESRDEHTILFVSFDSPDQLYSPNFDRRSREQRLVHIKYLYIALHINYTYLLKTIQKDTCKDIVSLNKIWVIGNMLK